MAAKKGNKNAAGNSGGHTYNDKQLAAEVRKLALIEVRDILLQEGLTEMKKQILLKLSSSILPRLNEHSGEGGGPIEQRIIYLPQRDGRVETTSRQTD
jgi:hypothetical protein